jgi:hypothetical protein
MKSNVYLYLMLVCLLAGGFAGFIGYDNLGSAERKAQKNQIDAENLAQRQADLESKRSELLQLRAERRSLQTETRKLASEISAEEKLIDTFSQLKTELELSIETQELKMSVNQRSVSEIQDQLAEDTTLIDRSRENMKALFELNRKRLEERQSALNKDDQSYVRERAKEISQLETEIDAMNFRLRRVNNLTPLELDDPWVVGEVIDFQPESQKVVLSIGSQVGVKPNFKFSIFSGDTVKDRVYKGFVVVKEVHPLVSIGVMEMEQGLKSAPVAGDQLGSLVFRRDQLKFYLAGDFRAKYNKDQIQRFIEYAGNEVLSVLTSDVDFFIMGALADNEVPKATALGVSIIPVASISSYLGE